MKIANLIKAYNLVGSLLENIRIDTSKRTITLDLDFCYWQQEGYVDGDEETGSLSLVFSDCGKFDICRHKINSDEIVNVSVVDDDSIDICVENDLSGEYYHLKISAAEVEVFNILL